MFVRQVALVARVLEPVVDDLCSVFGVEVAFHDPGVATFGLRNALMPVGTTFFEVVCPQTPDATAARYLARRGGDGGYMVILQTDDLAAARTRLTEQAVRIVWEIALDDIATVHLHPRDIGGAIVSIDEPKPPQSWRWAGPDWAMRRGCGLVTGIDGVEIAAQDPARMAGRWAATLGSSAQRRSAERWTVPLDTGYIDFSEVQDPRGEGIVAVGLRAPDPDAVHARARGRGLVDPTGAITIGGTRFDLHLPGGTP